MKPEDFLTIVALASCLLPTSIAAIISWLLIRKQRTVIGIAAGQGVILLFLASVYFYLVQRVNSFRGTSLYSVAAFVDGMLFNFAIGIAVIDAMTSLGIGLLLTLIYRRRLQRQISARVNKHTSAPSL